MSTEQEDEEYSIGMPVPMDYRGVWFGPDGKTPPATPYRRGAVVSHGGNLWVVVAAAAGRTEPVAGSAVWDRLAGVKGEPGAQGVPGLPR